MILRLDHIGIAVKDLEEALRSWEGGLGLPADHRETVPDQAVRTAFLPVGDTHVELLESLTPEGPIGRFIARRGEGIHHLCFLVDDLEAALAACRQAGMALIDETPRDGAHGRRVVFVHPKSTHGVLIELSQKQEGAS